METLFIFTSNSTKNILRSSQETRGSCSGGTLHFQLESYEFESPRKQKGWELLGKGKTYKKGQAKNFRKLCQMIFKIDGLELEKIILKRTKMLHIVRTKKNFLIYSYEQ